MRGGQQRACRYGNRCTRLPQGTCRYYHSPTGRNSLQFQHQRNQQGANFGFTDYTHQRNSSPTYYTQNTHEYSFSKRNFNYHNSSPPNSKHLVLNFNEYKECYKENQKERFQERVSNDDPFERILCRDYHLGMECKFGLSCPRKHAFTITEQQILRRLQFTRHFPLDPRSRLTKFKFLDKEYFTIRNGIQVNFLEFNCQKKILEEVFKYTFPDPQGTYNFYDQKNYNIFFSKDNNDTSYDDMGIYNILEAKTYYVTNSHVGKITGIAQFSNNVFFSTSMRGQLKVWVIQDGQLVCHQQIMEKLRSQFNPQNAQIQLYFVDISEVNGIKIISVGTSDGRLLLFFGNDFNFIQVMLGQQNAKVFKIRYTSRQNVPTALVLTWNSSKTFSSIIEIDLVNFSIRPLIQVPTTEGQFEFLLSICEIVYGYLMVGNVQGILSIYPYPDTTNKIGVIFHQNHIADIVSLQSDNQNTNTKMKMMFVLEKMIGQRQGSLGIYVMK